MTPARLLVLYLVSGIALTALGLYGPLVEWAGAGATVPLTGFGYTLAMGVRDAVGESGLLGAFTGGVRAAAAGIATSVFFGYVVALLAKPGDKS